MAITVHSAGPLTIPNTVGTYTVDIDVGTNPKLLVCFATSAGSASYGTIGIPKVDGQTIPYVDNAAHLSNRTFLYYLLDPAPVSGAVTASFQLTDAWGGSTVFFFAAEADLALELVGAIDKAATAATDPAPTFDSGSQLAVALAGASGSATAHGTMTEVGSGGNRASHETTPTTGSRTVGYALSGASSAIVAMFGMTTNEIVGSHVGMSLGVRGGTLSYEGLLRLPYKRVRGLVLGLRRGTIALTAKRQVALVGEGFETAEMTVGGTEGQVLTQHTGRPPTWEDAGSGDPATTVESETTFGIAPAVGTDTEYARQDHTHGTPSATAVSETGRWEVLLTEDGSEPLTTEDGSDWLYVWVTD